MPDQHYNQGDPLPTIHVEQICDRCGVDYVAGYDGPCQEEHCRGQVKFVASPADILRLANFVRAQALGEVDAGVERLLAFDERDGIDGEIGIARPLDPETNETKSQGIVLGVASLLSETPEGDVFTEALFAFTNSAKVEQAHPEPHKLLIDSPQDCIAEEWCAVRADQAETTIDAVKYALEHLRQDLSDEDGSPIKLNCAGKSWLRFKQDPDEPCECLDIECPTCSAMEFCKRGDDGAVEYWSITLETTEDAANSETESEHV